MRYPLVAPLAALTAGIVAAHYTPFSFRETLLSCLLCGLLAWVGVRFDAGRAGRFACLVGFGFLGALLPSDDRPAALGAIPSDPLLITSVLEREKGPPADWLRDPVRLQGWVARPPESLGLADRFVLEAEAVFRDSPVRGAVRVTVYRSQGEPPLDLEYGRRIEFLAAVRPPRNFGNPGSFDWAGYLRRQGIHLTAYVRSGTPIFDLPGKGGSLWEARLWNARQGAAKRFDRLVGVGENAEKMGPISSNVPSADRISSIQSITRSARSGLSPIFSQPRGPGAAEDAGPMILRALLLGDRLGLGRETIERFQRTGTYHALVISGLHVGVVAALAIFLLRMLGAPRWLQAALALSAVTSYALLAGSKVPVARAGCMFAAVMIAALVYRRRRALNVVAGTAFGFLMVDPELLFEAGFQMSFLAVAMIAGIGIPLLEMTVEPYRRALSDVWNEDLDLHLPPPVAQRRVALRMILQPLRKVTRLPKNVLAWMICGPLRALTWCAALALVSLVIQAGLALPLAVHFHRVSWTGIFANLFVVPLLFVAVPAGLLGLLFESRGLVSVGLWAASTTAEVVETFAARLPLEMRVPSPPTELAVLFAAALLLLAASFSRGRKPALASGTLVAVLLVVLLFHPFPPRYTPGSLELTALDVGQGEALLLALPEGKTVLVDTGGMPDFGGIVRRGIDIGEQVVSPYLWSRSIQRIDVVAISHFDADHVGGLPAILRNFPVGALWVADDNLGPEWARMEAWAGRYGVPVVRMRRGDRQVLDGVRFDVLGPSGAGGDLKRNDRSLVLAATYGSHRFLLTGDVEEKGESALLESAAGGIGPSQVLKVAHHGSRTSTHPRFLDRVRPWFALVSAGYRNPYRHPHETVVKRLEDRGIVVLRTDVEGAITVTSDGKRLRVGTFRGDRAGRRPSP